MARMVRANPGMLVKGGKQIKFRPPFGGVAEMLEHWAKKQPEKTAIEFIDVDRSDKSHKGYKNYNWTELREKVFGAAGMLRKRGLGRGDTIAFGYHNHPNILILSLAAWTSGIRTVPLDLKRDDEEMIRYKLELSEAKIVFRQDEEWDKSYKDYKNYKLRQKIPLSAEALVLFTSGTTAKPKGALLTQENLVANADGIADWLEIKNNDKFMILLPLHHINSMTMSLATLLRGGTIVLLSRYSNSRFFEIAVKTGATLTSVVPTIIHDQLGRLRAAAFRVDPRRHFFGTLGQGPSLTSSSPPGQSKSKVLSGSSSMTSKMVPSGQPFGGLWQVRLSRIQLGSAPVSAKEAEEFVKMTGIPLIQGYGQTETALRSTGVKWNPKKPLMSVYWRNLRSNTIGSEMKWTNVAVIREGTEGTPAFARGLRRGEEGKEGKEGEEGEICVRGPVIMKKYLKNPAATGEAFKYGWFHSGDLGYFKIVDGEKQFFIKGRIKEIIIKAGVNVSPMAVEEKILKAIPEVDQVYVVGIPDERVGEEVGAVIVWSKDKGRRRKEEGRRKRGIRRIRGISEFEMPKYWFSVAVEKLPMTSTGKVKRVKLREMFKESAAIAETNKYMFRVISAVEKEMIEAARQMYNRYWLPLSADKNAWEQEVKQKILIGAIDKISGRLGGWIRVKSEGKMVMADAVTAAGNKNYKSYKNDSISIANARSLDSPDVTSGSLGMTTRRDVEIYLRKKIDPVIEFHRRPKAGWKLGAEIVRVVANARPGDVPALGYGVVMEYPEFAKMPEPKLTEASLGTQLVEAGLGYAYKRGFSQVRVLSRPVGLFRWALTNEKRKMKNVKR